MRPSKQDIATVLGFWPLLLPMPVLADPVMDVPQGCTGFLTIQLENCSVLNHWRCERDPSGRYSVTKIDSDQTEIQQQVLEGLSLLEMTVVQHDQRITVDQIDLEEYHELLEKGADTYASVLRYDDSGYHIALQGQNELTGKTVVIDGVDLLEVKSTSEFTHPSGQITRKTVMQYIMPSGPLWVPDRIMETGPDNVIAHLGPVDFVWPGQDGFMTRVPRFNCSPPLS